MYRAIEKGIAYYTVDKKDSPFYLNELKINLEDATQEELKMLYEIGHSFVIKDEPKSKKTVE